MAPVTLASRGRMKAIVQDRYGSPADVLHLEEIDKPTVDDDRVLVRIRAASVNALDWHLTGGLGRMVLGLRRPRIGIRGVDLAGHVEAVGKNVTRWKPGDEVFGTALGTFAEYATTAEDCLVSKPRGLTFEQAAAVPVAGFTALQGLRDKARLGAGQRVLIYGAGGGVGTFTVQIAKSLGAHVTAVTRTENLDLVRSIGADELIDYNKEDFTKRERLYDVLFDIGANRSLTDCRHVLSAKGTLVLAGAGSGSGLAPLTRILKALALSPLVRQRLVPFVAKSRQEDLVALKDLMETRKLSPVIDRQVPLSEVPDAVRYVGTGQARGKVVIHVD